MIHFLPPQKIAKLNHLLTQQHNQHNHQFFLQDQQDSPLINRLSSSNELTAHSRLLIQQATQPLFNRKSSNIVKSKSKGLLASQVKNRIEEMEDQISMQMKPQSRIVNQCKFPQFKKYQFKPQSTASVELKKSNDLISSKVINYANQSTQASKIKSKKLVDINHDIVKKYFRAKITRITPVSKASEVFQMVNPLYQLCGVHLEYPLIKLYRNCVYFGQHAQSKHHLYEGILIFYQKKKLYYGQFLNEKKHGYGMEIDFNEDAVFIGSFEKGHKIDHFQVVRPGEVYRGSLVNSLYEGYGELHTKCSVYKGYFQKGQRHGEGKEYFPETGLVISGTFIHNTFSNHQGYIAQSRAKEMRNSRIGLNPEQGVCEFNYELGKESAVSLGKRKGAIRHQRAGRKETISEQKPLWKGGR